jgi:hypothetical protein
MIVKDCQGAATTLLSDRGRTTNAPRAATVSERQVAGPVSL